MLTLHWLSSPTVCGTTLPLRKAAVSLGDTRGQRSGQSSVRQKNKINLNNLEVAPDTNKG